MALQPPSEIRSVTGLSDDQTQQIINFLQGAVYCWCKNKPDQWFSLRDLMGGENYFWQGTPLIALWNKHSQTATNPVKEAGKDGGWLLKRVIADDPRTFETREASFIREYHWLSNIHTPQE